MAFFEVIDWAQTVAGLALVVFLLIYYRRFLRPLLRFCCRFPGLVALLLLLYLLVYAQLGTGYGIPYLFWQERFLSRAWSSSGCTLLLAVLGSAAYHLDRYPYATNHDTGEWLRDDEYFRARVIGWWTKRLRVRAPSSVPGAVARGSCAPSSVPGAVARGTFLLNVLIDPSVVTPLQIWLEPTRESARRLQRFLRTARTPFLLLLLAPAALPGFFRDVPHNAPSLRIGLKTFAPIRMVDRDPIAYALGLSAWWLGIVLETIRKRGANPGKSGVCERFRIVT